MDKKTSIKTLKLPNNIDSQNHSSNISLKIEQNSQEKALLACDVGLKRIGLAIFKQGIILPLAPIHRQNRNQAAAELSTLLKARDIKILIIGLPSGENSDSMQKRIRHFVSLLTFKHQICYVDENMSSAQSLQKLSYMRRTKRADAIKDGRLDSLSACEILRRYIEIQNYTSLETTESGI